jgi:hypothetical protein
MPSTSTMLDRPSIESVPRDPHPNNLRNPGAAHVADGCPAQIVELEIRNFRSLAGALPCPAEFLDRFPLPDGTHSRIRWIRHAPILTR